MTLVTRAVVADGPNLLNEGSESRYVWVCCLASDGLNGLCLLQRAKGVWRQGTRGGGGGGRQPGPTAIACDAQPVRLFVRDERRAAAKSTAARLRLRSRSRNGGNKKETAPSVPCPHSTRLRQPRERRRDEKSPADGHSDRANPPHARDKEEQRRRRSSWTRRETRDEARGMNL